MNTNPHAKTILCFGDSNTFGQKPDKSGRFAADERWTGLLQEGLGDDYSIIEEGLSSRTTDLDYARKPGRNGKTYLIPCLESHRPLDLVILVLGTNDLKIEFDRSAKEIAKAVEGLVTSVRELSPAKLMIVSPILIDDTAPHFYEFYTDYYNHDSAIKSTQLAAELEVVAKENDCYFVDAAKVARAGDDGIHFSKEAHEGLGRLLIEEVKKVNL